MPDFTLTVLILGLAVGTLTTTISQSRIFKPLREWVLGVWPWGGDLISCPYCLGHWAAVSIFLVTDSNTIPWAIATWLAVAGVAALVSGTITRLHGD